MQSPVEVGTWLALPSHVRVCESVDVEPAGQTRPLGRLPAVDGDAPLRQLVLAGFQVIDHLHTHT